MGYIPHGALYAARDTWTDEKSFFVLTVVACLAAFNSTSSPANAADTSTVRLRQTLS